MSSRMVGTPANDRTRRAWSTGSPLCGARRADVSRGGHELEKTVLQMLLGMGGHKGALALAPHHEVFGRQLVNGLAHRALTHAKACSQLHLAGDGFARFPLALLQTLQDEPFD